MSQHASSQTYNLPIKIIVNTPSIQEDVMSKLSLDVDPSDCLIRARATQTCHTLISPDTEEGSSSNLLKLNILDNNIKKIISSMTNDQMKLSQKTDGTNYVIIQIIQMDIVEKRFSITKADSTSIIEDIDASLLELEPCVEQPASVNIERTQITSKKEDFDAVCIEPQPTKEQSIKDTFEAKSIKSQDAIESLIKNIMIAPENNVINTKKEYIDAINEEPQPNRKQNTTNNIEAQQIIPQDSIEAPDKNKINIIPINNHDFVCIEAQPKKEEVLTDSDKTNQITSRDSIETLIKTTDNNDINNTPKKDMNAIYIELQPNKEQEVTNNPESKQIIIQDLIKALSKTVFIAPDTIEIKMTPTNNFDANCIVDNMSITDMVETKLIRSHNSSETLTKIIMMAPDKNEINTTPTTEHFNEVKIKPKSSYEQLKEAIYEIENKIKEMPEHLLKNRVSYLQWNTLSLEEKKQVVQIEAIREIEELNKHMIKSEKKRLYELRRLNKVQAKLKKKLNEAENEVIRAKMMEGLTKLNRPHFKDTY